MKKRGIGIVCVVVSAVIFGFTPVIAALSYLSLIHIFLRLANFLLANWDGAQGDQVRLSQQELAYAINCSRASVSRACRLLKQEGIIIPQGVGFRLADREKLDRLCQARGL